MIELNVPSIAKELMNSYFSKAFEALENMSAKPEKIEFLKTFSYQLIERNK